MKVIRRWSRKEKEGGKAEEGAQNNWKANKDKHTQTDPKLV